MIIVTHPTGNRNVRAVVTALQEAGMLREFATTLAFNRSASWLRCIPASLRRELLRRTYGLPSAAMHTRPWREAVRLLAARRWLAGLARHETGWASVDSVYGDLDRDVAQRLPAMTGAQGIYAYEDGAYHAFKAAGQLGLQRFYDLPIGYWKAARRLLEEEAELQPEWAPTLTGNIDSAGKVARKDEELRLADVIFVASSFTRKTLEGTGIDGRPVYLIPYGAPQGTQPRTEKVATGSGKLRVLFVGSLGQRKGLSYLLEAANLLGSAVQLTLIGRPAGEICPPVRAAITKFRYLPSLPHQEVLAEMGRHDVLVFPSLFEGFGLVILEAMSQGLPVITTPHTAGPDIINEGHDGFIVPIRSSLAIAERLAWFAEHREETRAMGESARAKAAEFTWANYGARIVEAITRHLAPRHVDTVVPARK